MDLAPGVTFLVGENGSGKSTLVEAVAAAYGLNPEGGSRNARFSTRATESGLGSVLRLVRGAGGRQWAFFLRAETMHGLYTYLESVGIGGLHERSHGEGFLEVLRTRFDTPGFYVLDEPESALSFSSCLALMGVLDDLTRAARRCCAPPTPRCSPRCPARRSSSSTTTGSGRSSGVSWRWSTTGGATSATRARTCGTCWG
nr:AAA family ATPase [Motilibacter aurantiacus]